MRVEKNATQWLARGIYHAVGFNEQRIAGAVIGSMLIVIGIVKAFLRNPSRPESSLGIIVLALMCAAAVSLDWLVCWLGGWAA